MLNAPLHTFRREPHRLLFPLGALLAAVGVLPWILFVLGLSDLYRPIFHSIGFRSMFHPLAEIEGFLGCFAVGAVLTILPRRTGSAPASTWQIALAVVAPVAIVISAVLQAWPVGQVAWLVLMAMVLEFSVRRYRSQTPPRALRWGSIWIAFGLFMGAAGAILASAGDLREGRFWLHEVGRALLTQGLFTGLALGMAELLSPPEALGPPRPARGAWMIAAHAFAGALFLVSFGLGQLVSASLGFALRALITLAVVLHLVRASRLARIPGALGRGARIALWMLPVGNAWAALMPASRRAGMHVIYLACFAMLVLVVSTSLSSSPAEDAHRPLRHARQLGLGWACLAVALGARILVEIDPPNFRIWLGIACLYFVLGLVFAFGRFGERLVSLLPTEGGAESAPGSHHK